jgi:chemotaxis response regulator CheB
LLEPLRVSPATCFSKAADRFEQAAAEVDCFNQLAKVISELPRSTDPNYEGRAENCLRELLALDKDMKVMDQLDKLKHIRRELNIILEVVREQTMVIKQMTDQLELGELDDFANSKELRRRRKRRAEKLEQRRQQMITLDTKADNIYKDVSNPGQGMDRDYLY